MGQPNDKTNPFQIEGFQQLPQLSRMHLASPACAWSEVDSNLGVLAKSTEAQVKMSFKPRFLDQSKNQHYACCHFTLNMYNHDCAAHSLNSELSSTFTLTQCWHSFKWSATVGGTGWRCVRQGIQRAFTVIGQKTRLTGAGGRDVDKEEWLSKNCVHFTTST